MPQRVVANNKFAQWPILAIGQILTSVWKGEEKAVHSATRKNDRTVYCKKSNYSYCWCCAANTSRGSFLAVYCATGELAHFNELDK